jgi:hypothetical protein
MFTKFTKLTQFTRRHLFNLAAIALIATLVLGLVVNVSPTYAQGNPQGRRGGGAMLASAVVQATVKATGLTRVEIMKQWADGKTLTQIITEKGASVDAVKTDAKTQATNAINQAVTNGRLTQAEADQTIAGLDKAIDNILTMTVQEAMQERINRGEDRAANLIRARAVTVLVRETADATGLTQRELLQELRSDKTLAQIATEKGADPAAIVKEAVTTITAQVNQAVTSGRLTQAQADELLANLESQLTEAMNEANPLRGNQGRGRR